MDETELSLLQGELIFTAVWLLCRAAVWCRRREIDWRREAWLLLMYVNLAVIIRFVFYPFHPVGGHVQPLRLGSVQDRALRLNLLPFVHLADYAVTREAVINHVGNVTLFIPTGVLLPILYRRLGRPWKVILAGAGISLAIELAQLLLPNSVTDIDDLILNTLGVCLGCGIFRLAAVTPSDPE